MSRPPEPPAPGRPGSVIVALPDDAAIRKNVELWAARVHTGITPRAASTAIANVPMMTPISDADSPIECP